MRYCSGRYVTVNR
uniref:Uncharacterized protein n=1 Tax=Candidatus Kentrum eta TaxID=2126337 RepID=A0A450UHV7_9GAMM|nr:MAG: hypothetical protein BECKH772A_GA0070896_1002512 [Candidatus Kentron sp. H]VFJ92116.1 MAG: hypothetical protein BECKH772B_GA0070898_1002512 [Candidatus Kentron sp. H]VFJ98695.1 MAG: hypothetical protein BECKH772C_GA0070978_1002412 [Candidatus Kentron sp. H]